MGFPAIWWIVHLAYFLFDFSMQQFLARLYGKNTQEFQALNDLKCSTVGNLGS